MGILSAIGTILPTVGTILGQLLSSIQTTDGVGDSSTYVAYDFGEGITGGFKRNASTGDITLCNTSLDDNAILTFSVPKMGQQEAFMLSVPSTTKIPVTDIFVNAANCDSTKIMLCGSSSDTTSQGILDSANDVFHYASGGSNIPADGVTVSRIGVYLKVVCHEDKAVFTSDKVIDKITSVSFYGRNDSKVVFSNVPGIQDGMSSTVTVVFPTPFAKGTYLEVDAEVDMCDVKGVLAEQSKKYTMTKMTEEDLVGFRQAAKRRLGR